MRLLWPAILANLAPNEFHDPTLIRVHTYRADPQSQLSPDRGGPLDKQSENTDYGPQDKPSINNEYPDDWGLTGDRSYHDYYDDFSEYSYYDLTGKAGTRPGASVTRNLREIFPDEDCEGHTPKLISCGDICGICAQDLSMRVAGLCFDGCFEDDHDPFHMCLTHFRSEWQRLRPGCAVTMMKRQSKRSGKAVGPRTKRPVWSLMKRGEGRKEG